MAMFSLFGVPEFLKCAEQWKPLVETVSYLVGAGAALAAWWVYRQNSQLERARWITALYEKFYERDGLKAIRDTLDQEDPDSDIVADLIDKESAEFTDYLNFFEFVAILKKSNQLDRESVEDLFGYYLGSLKKHKTVVAYIGKNGYEHLSALLKFGRK